MLYSEQLRAARALLRWEQSTVAAHARVSVETVKRLERLDGPIVAVKVATIEAIRRALEAAGIEFIDPEEGKRGPGVALKWGTVVGHSPGGRETGKGGDGSGRGRVKTSDQKVSLEFHSSARSNRLRPRQKS